MCPCDLRWLLAVDGRLIERVWRVEVGYRRLLACLHLNRNAIVLMGQMEWKRIGNETSEGRLRRMPMVRCFDSRVDEAEGADLKEKGEEEEEEEEGDCVWTRDCE
jgi:hypothetical protein